MQLPLTLPIYIGKQFLYAIATAFAAMLLIVALGDSVELIRRTADIKIPFSSLIEMVLLKTPATAIHILPFAVLIGGMTALTKLTRTQELIVARASGFSVWQFLLPAIILVFIIGLFFIAIVNPLSSVMLSRFEQLDSKFITGKTSLLSISSGGLWINQPEQDGSQVKEHIFHALKVEKDGLRLSPVIIFNIGENSKFLGRIDAEYAELEQKHWNLHNVTINILGELPSHKDTLLLKTDLTPAQIQNSFASPLTLSFWQLPKFIATLEKAGFSALRHRMYLHEIISSPILLCAMILIAAVFSLRLPRRGGIVTLIAAGVITGFGVHFFTNLVYAFGQSGEMPIIIAAWAPSLIALMVGGGLLLHLEDG